MIRVVVTNTNLCRMYEFNSKSHELTLLKEISYPQNRHKTGDYLTSDKPGRYQSDMSTGGSYQPHMDPKQAEIDKLAREIANDLDVQRNHNDFDKLVIIAAPHMMGLLSQHLNKHVKQLIIAEIQKDILNLSLNELQVFLKSQQIK